MDVIEAIHGRRSVRSYDSRPVGRDLIESLILDAAQAPPPHRDLTPWTFNVVEGVQRIAGYGARALDYAKNHHPDEPGWVGSTDPASRYFGTRLHSSLSPAPSAIAVAPARI
jgi:nitroreductase